MILLTGASGFLGRAILDQGRRDFSFRTAGRKIDGSDDHVQVDLVNQCLPDDAFKEVDTVVHAAGLAHQFGTDAGRRENFFGINAHAVEKVVNAAKQNDVKHVVLVSSMSVYGPGNEQPRKETDATHPQGYYAESKYHGENLAIESVNDSNLKLTILRMATLYGEGDQGNVNRLIGAIDRGRFLLIGDCQNQKNLVYKSDAAKACLLATSNSNSNQVSIYNVASDPVTMRQVVEFTCRHLGRELPTKIPKIFVNGLRFCSSITMHKGPLARIHESVEKFIRSDLMDGSKFANDFAFQPEVGLEEGLRRQVASYKDNGDR